MVRSAGADSPVFRGRNLSEDSGICSLPAAGTEYSPSSAAAGMACTLERLDRPVRLIAAVARPDRRSRRSRRSWRSRRPRPARVAWRYHRRRPPAFTASAGFFLFTASAAVIVLAAASAVIVILAAAAAAFWSRWGDQNRSAPAGNIRTYGAAAFCVLVVAFATHKYSPLISSARPPGGGKHPLSLTAFCLLCIVLIYTMNK